MTSPTIEAAIAERSPRARRVTSPGRMRSGRSWRRKGIVLEDGPGGTTWRRGG